MKSPLVLKLTVAAALLAGCGNPEPEADAPSPALDEAMGALEPDALPMPAASGTETMPEPVEGAVMPMPAASTSTLASGLEEIDTLPAADEPQGLASNPTASAAVATGLSANVRCPHLDVCADGAEILCPNGTPMHGQPAWTCLLFTETDPSTGQQCEAFTWYFLGDCDGNDPDESRFYTAGKMQQQYARASSGAIWYRNLQAGRWGAWVYLGGYAERGPSVTSDSSNSQHVFVRGSDGAVWENRWAGRWLGWRSLGGVVTNKPVAIKNYDGRISVFVRGVGGAVFHKYQLARGTNAAWSGWQNLGGYVDYGPVRPMINTNGTLEIFVTAFTHIYHSRGRAGTAWTGWADLGRKYGRYRPQRLRYGYLKVIDQLNSTDRYMRYQVGQSSTTWAGWSWCPVP
ncbi:MAG: hypothetical protein IPJ65_42145 [Archangiaceae bacterium]|nr:hypothetical protein [Archangiaceae bacterium]